METTETLSKAEYQYLKNIEKLEQLTEKLEAALAKEKSANAELTSKLEALQGQHDTIKTEHSELSAANENLKKEIEQHKADLDETTKECQLHVDNMESQNDELEKQIQELKAHILPEEETEKEVKLIYHKQGLMGKLLGRNDKSNWMQQKVLSSDTKRIQSLVDDGYKKKETELPIQLKK